MFFQPHLTEYQRKQRERPAVSDAIQKKAGEPLTKKLKRKSSVEPLEDRGSPLPDLPNDLREKQDLFDLAAGKSRSLSPAPPLSKPHSLGHTNAARQVNGNATSRKQSIGEIVADGMKDPLQIIELIRERKDIGFLYMSAAVSRSSIEYNPYNLKYVYDLTLFFIAEIEYLSQSIIPFHHH